MRERGLLLGRGNFTSWSAVHGVTVHLAVRGTFRVRTATHRWQTSQATLISPDIPRQVDAQDALVATFLLIPETPLGRRLTFGPCGDGLTHVDPSRLRSIRQQLSIYLENGCSNAEAAEITDDVFRSLSDTTETLPGLDERIVAALSYIHSTPDHHPSIAAIAEAVSLSPSRFSHLFTQEVGIPVRRYLLWRRLRAALDEMATPSSLTDVAHRTRFADSAHLSRTFRMILGSSPSELLRGARVVKTDL
jgi:AraC-like DNA-binding protein